MRCECCEHQMLHEILKKLEALMGLNEDLLAKQQAANDALTQLGTDLTAEIADLKAKIVAASGGAITPDQATALLAGMDSIIAKVGTLDTQAKAE